MSGPNNQEEKRKRRRRLRAALVLLRRRLIKACNTVSSVGSFYDDVAKNLEPIMAEFADVLPDGARRHLENVSSTVNERRADLETACKLCKGELKSAITDVAKELGFEGMVREALRPLEEHAPEWFTRSPAAPLIAAVVVVATGGGVVAGIAVAANGSDSKADNAPSAVASSTANLEPGDTASPDGTTGLPDPCQLITLEDAEAIVGLDMVQASETLYCLYSGAEGTGGATSCPRVTISVSELTGEFFIEPGALVEPAVGDEAYYSATNNLIVRTGNVTIAVGAWLKEPPCDADQTEIDSWRDEWVELAEIALERL